MEAPIFGPLRMQPVLNSGRLGFGLAANALEQMTQRGVRCVFRV